MLAEPSALRTDRPDTASHAPRHTGHGNRAGARRHAVLNPAIDARPAAIALAERERSAIELRKADCTYQQIADALGYKSAAGARSAVIRGLGRWMRDADEPLRVLELARTDEIGQHLWPLMDADNPHVVLTAIATYLRLLDYRAKISGLYTVKPPRPEVVAATAPTRDPKSVMADVERFMVLTNQMREDNAVVDVDAVRASSLD